MGIKDHLSSLFSSSSSLKDRAQANLKRVFETNEKKLSFSGSTSESTEDEDSVIEEEHSQLNSKAKSLLKGVFFKWLLLGLIGAFMAICSLCVDLSVKALGDLQFTWIDMVRPAQEGLSKVTVTYGIWILFSLVAISIAATIVRVISQEAVGSGIPEIKTVLRGVQLEGYLNFKTLVAVLFSLTFALSSNIPIGKAGPFVHAAAIVANLVSKLIKSFDTGTMTGSMQNEMLAAGCAVGLACTFGAPVGGVLFSIEVTSTFFAVRNYWMNFFAATCATTVFRLLRVALSLDVSVVSIFQTQLPQTCFFVEELPLFALIGLFCGFGSAFFIYLHRKIVLFRRNNAKMKKIFDKHWILYPIFVSILIASLTYPDGYGNFIGGEHKFSVTTHDLFLNCTWSAEPNSTYRCPEDLLNSWLDADEEGKQLNLFMVLSMFTGTFFILTAIAITLPVPAGIFGPAFSIGSGFGRLIGELVAITYPNGVRNDGQPVWPAVYAVVGAASFCGGITHTISTAVVAYELTGQLVYILPVMIAVLIANAVCSYLQPSIYDSLIELRALPYLPNIPNSENFHGIKVAQFMVRNVRFLTPKSTFKDVRDLITKTTLKAVPIVEERTQILIGSCPRAKLMQVLEQHIGPDARKSEARARVRLTQRISSMENHFQFPQHGTKIPSLDIESLESGPLTSPKYANFFFDDDDEFLKSPLSPIGRAASTPINTRTPNTPTTPTENQYRAVLSPGFDSKPKLESFDVRGGRFFSGSAPTTPSGTMHNSNSLPATLGQNLSKVASTRPEKFPLNEANADLYGVERRQWEAERLLKTINTNSLSMDPTPFQLYNNTTLLKTYSMFSLLGLQRAYITKCGRLIGVVSLRDLRLAIERVNSGQLSANNIPLEEDFFEDELNAQQNKEWTLGPPKRMTLFDIHEDEDKETREQVNSSTVAVQIEEAPVEVHSEFANRANCVLKRLEEREAEEEEIDKPLKKRKSF